MSCSLSSFKGIQKGIFGDYIGDYGDARSLDYVAHMSGQFRHCRFLGPKSELNVDGCTALNWTSSTNRSGVRKYTCRLEVFCEQCVTASSGEVAGQDARIGRGASRDDAVTIISVGRSKLAHKSWYSAFGIRYFPSQHPCRNVQTASEMPR